MLAESNKMFGFVKRNTCYLQSTNVRRSIYLTIVRPHLGYAAQVWAPKSIYHISNLEKIQRRATKHILKLPFLCCQSYKQWLKTLSLPPISSWYEYLDMLLFFKIIHGMVDIDPTIVFIAHSTRHTWSSANIQLLPNTLNINVRLQPFNSQLLYK